MNRFVRFSIFAGLAVVLVACSSGTPPPSGGSTDPIAAGFGRVTGVVTSSAGATVAGASVEFTTENVDSAAFIATLDADAVMTLSTRTVMSGADGSFTADLPAGSYSGLVLHTDLGEGTVLPTFTVAEGIETSSDVALRPLGTIKGVAQQPGADSHLGITIAVPGTSFTASTDATGAFTLRGLPASTYALVAYAGGGLTPAVVEGVNVRAGETTALTKTLTVGVSGPVITSVPDRVVFDFEIIDIEGFGFGSTPGYLMVEGSLFVWGPSAFEMIRQNYTSDYASVNLVWTDTRVSVPAHSVWIGEADFLGIATSSGALARYDHLLTMGSWPLFRAEGALSSCSDGEFGYYYLDCGFNPLGAVAGESIHGLQFTTTIHPYFNSLINEEWQDEAYGDLSGKVYSGVTVSGLFYAAVECDHHLPWDQRVLSCNAGSSWDPVAELHTGLGWMLIEDAVVTSGVTDEDGISSFSAGLTVPVGAHALAIVLTANGKVAPHVSGTIEPEFVMGINENYQRW